MLFLHERLGELHDHLHRLLGDEAMKLIALPSDHITPENK